MGGVTRLVAWLLVVGSLAAIGYGARAAGGEPDEDALYRYEVAISGIVVYLILLAIVYAIGTGLPRRDFFALRPPDSWPRALGLALGAYIAILVGVGLLLFALDARDEQGLTPESWDPSRAWAYAANFVAVAFVGPVVEELTYRGAGLSLLLRYGAPAAVVVTALPFALGHGLVRAMPALLLFGIVIALLRLRTNSVYPCILVHCAFNATSLIVAVTA